MAKRLCLVILIGSAVSGCAFLGPRPTPEPIYVTATPVAVLDTPVDTVVVAPTSIITDTPPELPTLAPATVTPPPPPLPTLTPSFTPTYTESPIPSPTKMKCTATPPAGFGTIYGKIKGLPQSLGCPLGSPVAITSDSITMENGLMLWASQFADVQTRMIYAVFNTGTYQRFEDTWVQNVDPESTGEIAPAGLLTPMRGFGKVWHNNPAVKSGLGWAKTTEVGTQGEIQRFERGEMLYVTTLGQTFIFVNGASATAGTWRSDPTPF